jgi:hypothetical protein
MPMRTFSMATTQVGVLMSPKVIKLIMVTDEDVANRIINYIELELKRRDDKDIQFLFVDRTITTGLYLVHAEVV